MFASNNHVSFREMMMISTHPSMIMKARGWSLELQDGLRECIDKADQFRYRYTQEQPGF